MKVISLVNQKGGVAKTTTAMALADGFARRGKRVLLLDFDPQGHLTTSYGLMDNVENPQSLRFLKLQKGDDCCPTAITHNLSIITSDIGLEKANTLLSSKVGRERYLLRAIKSIPPEFYDYIIIDSNPSLSITTLNVLVASDYVLIPFKPEFNSFKGIDLLLESVDDVKSINEKIDILGFVVTMSDNRRSSTKEAIEYITELAEQKDSCVFKSVIRNAVACADAPSHSKSLYEYAPTSQVSRDYEQLCEEILSKLEV